MSFFKDFHIIWQFIIVLFVVNTLIALYTVFHRPRSISSVFAWMFALIFLPGIGFFLYLFAGRGIDREIIRRYAAEKNNQLANINARIEKQNQNVEAHLDCPNSSLLKNFLNSQEGTILTKGNQVEVITDGQEKFDRLFKDLEEAKETIHIEYYAIFNDQIGNAFLAVLVKKAKEGLKVRVLFDPFGGDIRLKFFKPLIESGGEVLPFITAHKFIRKTRLNYHLHRKIVVIDGAISWTGGFNVGDQYLTITKKFGFWRDTHFRIVGTASYGFQEIFLRDWNVSALKQNRRLPYDLNDFKIIEPAKTESVSIHVVADGPEDDLQILKGSFIKMLLGAKKRVWFQTPYLIPDDSMIEAILIAVRSGIDVRIMIPCMPDHPFIYRATQYYANFLHQHGVKIYIYHGGFLHAKVVLMDDYLSSFGTANQDIRSYALNFEVNAFAYNKQLNQQLSQIFEADMQQSILLTDAMIAQQPRRLRIKQSFSRLMSPIL